MKRTFIFFLISFPLIFFGQEKIQFVDIYFSSKCCGTQSDEKFNSFIKDFKIQNNINVIYGYAICCLGEEGEYSIIIDIRNFSSPEKENLIKGFEKLQNVYSEEYKNSNKGSIVVRYIDDIQKIHFPKEAGKSSFLKF